MKEILLHRLPFIFTLLHLIIHSNFIISSTNFYCNAFIPTSSIVSSVSPVRNTISISKKQGHGIRNGHERRRNNNFFFQRMMSSTDEDVITNNDINTLLDNPVDLKYTEYTNNNDNNNDNNDNDPVILLHGLLGQKRNFASLGTSLSTQLTKKRKIYALDLRNHGDNTHDWRNEMSYTHMCHDVLAFMNNHDLKNVVLIGHSMGGKVAKSLALSYPNRISGLVILDIAPVKYTIQDPAWKAVKSIIDTLQKVTIDTPGMTKRTIDMELRSSVEDPALRAFVLTNIEEDRVKKVLAWKINIMSIKDQLDVIAGFDVNHIEMHDNDNSDINVDDDNDNDNDNNTSNDDNDSDSDDVTIYKGDTFFINGGTSSFVKGSHMQVISQYFPNYMLTTIRGSGHWVHAEAPDDTLALLKRYLDR